MEHYVTLFDSLFLPQGLALHMSMERHAGAYTLWILCLDGDAYNVLTKLSLPNIRLLQLCQLETDELKRVKATRTKREYCWTLTPFAPRFVFEADPLIVRVTYLDADMWFQKKPNPIFKEFRESGKHVLITDHAYAPEYDQTVSSGQYCVQFVTFNRDGGESVRKWWEERCIEWCYARFEDGKFGDQKYLDDWPERFEQLVHVLNSKELMLAPWNAIRFPYSGAVMWHFHALRITKIKQSRFFVIFGNYPLPSVVRQQIYLPYLKDIGSAVKCLTDLHFHILPQAKFSLYAKLTWLLRGIWRQVWRINLNMCEKSTY